MNALNRRALLLQGSALSAALALPTRAWSQPPDAPWPAITRITVPFSAGGAVDIMARKLGEALGPRLKTAVVVDNKVGATGLIAIQAVARAPADGANLLYLTSGQVTMQALTQRVDLLAQFKPVTKISAGPNLLLVPGSSPYKTQAELIAAIKAHPGKLNYGSGGVASPPHLAFELLGERVPGGLPATHVPFKSLPEAVTGLLSADIDFAFALPALALPHLSSGKLRALSTTGTARLAFLPDVPTVAEAGVKGYSFDAWGGLVVPAKTPDAVVARLHEALVGAVRSPEMAAMITKLGGVLEASASPAAFAEQLRVAIQTETALVKRLGLKAE